MMTGFRRLISLMLLIAVTLTILPAAQAKAVTDEFGLVYNSAQVNLRQQPTQNSTWLGAYASGTWVQITGESGNWYYVTGPDGKNGYMSKNYVQVKQPRIGDIGVVNNPRANDFLNLRQQPNYSSRVLEIYYNGVPCVLTGYANGWYAVKVDGTAGYFRKEYLSTQNNVYYAEDVATVVTPNNSYLNLRTGPGLGYGVAGQIRGGKYVMVLQKGSTWWKIIANGQVCYAMASFLKDGVHTPVGMPGGNGGGSGGSSSAPSTGGQATAVVSNPRATQVLNLREMPSLTARVLGQFSNGVKVTVLHHGEEWCHVRTAAGVEGYMMTEYLTLKNLPAQAELTVTHPQRTFVNLRKGGSLTAGIITRIPHGSTVTVLAYGSGWTKVRYNGMTGYMMSAFLK